MLLTVACFWSYWASCTRLEVSSTACAPFEVPASWAQPWCKVCSPISAFETAVCAFTGKDKEAQHRCAIKLGQQFEIIKGRVEQIWTAKLEATQREKAWLVKSLAGLMQFETDDLHSHTISWDQLLPKQIVLSISESAQELPWRVIKDSDACRDCAMFVLHTLANCVQKTNAPITLRSARMRARW